MFKLLSIRAWLILVVITGVTTVGVVAFASQSFNTSNPTCVPVDANISSSATEVLVGQNLQLFAAVSGPAQHTVTWSAQQGVFGDANAKATTYTAPTSGTNDVLTLHVASDCGSDDKTLPITIIAAPNEPNPTPSDTPTLTSTLTPTSQPSDTPTITNTPSHTPTHTPVTPSATPTTPQPSLALLEPKNATCVGLGQNVVFQWQYVRALNNVEGPDGEYFALDLWTTGTPKQSVAWIKQPQYIVDVSNPVPVFLHFVDCQVESGCFWSVSVIRANRFPGQDPFDGDHTVLASSSNRVFCTRGNLPPTSTPTQRPNIPPTDTPAPP